MLKLSFDEVVQLVKAERDFQDNKWGTLEQRQTSISSFILILEAELEEAKAGWCKNVPGKHSALRELIQVAAVAFACIQTHGAEGN